MVDTRQLSLLDALDGHTAPPLPVPSPLPAPPDLASRLEELDRQLAPKSRLHLPPLPVVVKQRANRSTMGSLRHRAEPRPHWVLTLASSLASGDPDCALLLAQVLLLRVRRLPVPLDLKRALKAGQTRWLAGQPPRNSPIPELQPSDPVLAQALDRVAKHAGLGLPERGLPSIHWQPFATARVLGRYDERRHLILIHQALDSAAVPNWALDALIYHEFLHALLGSEQQGSRRVHHHTRFRRTEAAWPDHDRWCLWIKEQWPACHRRWKRRQPSA